jgi:hypothetical protein
MHSQTLFECGSTGAFPLLITVTILAGASASASSSSAAAAFLLAGAFLAFLLAGFLAAGASSSSSSSSDAARARFDLGLEVVAAGAAAGAVLVRVLDRVGAGAAPSASAAFFLGGIGSYEKGELKGRKRESLKLRRGWLPFDAPTKSNTVTWTTAGPPRRIPPHESDSQPQRKMTPWLFWSRAM